MKIMITLILAIFIGGCNSQSLTDDKVKQTIEFIEAQETQMPDFVIQSNSNANVNPSNCLELDIAYVWEPQDTSDILYNHMYKTLPLTVDNKYTYKSFDVIESWHLAGTFVYDSSGNIIAHVIGPLYLCAPTDNLSLGKHLATINFTSTSDKTFEYTWVFEK